MTSVFAPSFTFVRWLEKKKARTVKNPYRPIDRRMLDIIWMIRWKWSDKKPLPGATNTRERGPFGRDATTTLGEWAAQWLEIYKKGKVEDGTYRKIHAR